MKYYQIPNTRMRVSSLIQGCMRIAGLSDREALMLVDEALDCGVNFFDHADVYGAGECEKKFSKTITSDDKRERMIIQGKCGIHKCGGDLDGYYDFSKGYILECVDQILSRLATDYLDVLLLHRPDALMEPEEVAEAFDILESSGKVCYFGVSNQSAVQIEIMQRACRQKLLFNQVQFGAAHTLMVDSGMSANTMLPQGVNRDNGVLEYSRMNGVTLQCWSPFQHGFFEGVFLGDNARYGKLNQVIDRLAEKYCVTPAAIAVAWIIRHPARMQVIVGTTKPSRLRECCAGADIALDRSEWYEIYKAAGNPIP